MRAVWSVFSAASGRRIVRWRKTASIMHSEPFPASRLRARRWISCSPARKDSGRLLEAAGREVPIAAGNGPAPRTEVRHGFAQSAGARQNRSRNFCNRSSRVERRICAEVVYVIREEMAQTIEDILLRRIGVQFHSWKEAAQAAPVVGQLLAREFGWSEAQTQRGASTLTWHRSSTCSKAPGYES